MKNKYCLNLIHTPLVALALVTGSAFAGVEETTMAPAPTPPPAEDVVSGVLNLDFNTHFISYGADVWADGDGMSTPGFNPMLELAFALPAGFTATLGTWWDVVPSSKDPGAADDSPIGGRIQEIDVWAGLTYKIDKFSVGVTYQNWFYASETEEILDLKFAYDTFLSPSLTLHSRLDAGGAGPDAGGTGDEGNVLVLGLSHSVELGPVTISFPFNLAYFIEEGFHSDDAAGNDSDNGLGYGSIGVAASYPLAFLEPIGEWSLHGGLTYYVTDQDVIPGNEEGDFLTANLGLTLAF